MKNFYGLEKVTRKIDVSKVGEPGICNPAPRCVVCGNNQISEEFHIHNTTVSVDEFKHLKNISEQFISSGYSVVDIREYQPFMVIIKIGACSEHKKELEAIHAEFLSSLSE